MGGSTGDAPSGVDYQLDTSIETHEAGSARPLAQKSRAMPSSSAAVPANAPDSTERIDDVTESKGDIEASFQWHCAW